MQSNAEAFPGETVAITAELPEPGLEVIWLKDNVQLSVGDARCETVNRDCSYQLLIPDVIVEDGGTYKVQGGDYEATIQLNICGEWQNNRRGLSKKDRSSDPESNQA